jgi:hypothetical protein
MSDDLKDVLAALQAGGKTLFEDWLKDEGKDLQAIGKKGVEFGKIGTEATVKRLSGQMPEKDYQEVTRNLWMATKSELLAKGFKEIVRSGDLLMNSLNMLSGIAGILLGKLSK